MLNMESKFVGTAATTGRLGPSRAAGEFAAAEGNHHQGPGSRSRGEAASPGAGTAEPRCLNRASAGGPENAAPATTADRAA